MRKTFNKYSAVAVITVCLMLTLSAPSAYADGGGGLGSGNVVGGGAAGSGNVTGGGALGSGSLEGGGGLGSGSLEGGGMAGSGNLAAVFTDLLTDLFG